MYNSKAPFVKYIWAL